jgi:peptidoglycan/LPS O-acetylase OafA/YrhL
MNSLMWTNMMGVAIATASGTIEHKTTKYAFIDALRGYAVLLVIICHTGGMFHDLPYPLKKLTNFGWHGVQLFFMMSCITLMLSWRSDEARGTALKSAFWLRRFFRITPMYYAAAVLYFLIETPPSGFNLAQMLASLGFVNAWHPVLIPTTPDRWMVVPGGWSIGVEFSFYLVFPLIVTLVRSMRAAVVFLAIALIVGSAANVLIAAPLAKAYGPIAADDFLYFWFPNQLPVFALGTILYFLLQRLWAAPRSATVRLFQCHGTVIVLGCTVAGVAAANLPFPHHLPPALPLIVPTLLVASIIFMMVVLVLGTTPGSPLINRWVRALGRVSFSAYLLHFAVLHKLPVLLPWMFDIHSTDWLAIFTWSGLCLTTVLITQGLSTLTFAAIERPMITLGKHVISATMLSPKANIVAMP